MNYVLLLRADASQKSGIGHIGRCLAFAETWQEQGGAAVLVATGPEHTLRDMANGVALEWLGPDPLLSTADSDRFLQLAGKYRADVALLDSYTHGVTFETSVRHHLPLISMDDLACRSHDADVVVDTSLNEGDFAPYQDKLEGPCTLLLGSRFVLLRRAFRQHGFASRSPDAVCRLLVSFGGTDPLDHTSAALDAIERLHERNIASDIVLSRANPRLPGLRSRIESMRGATLHIDTLEMAGLMARADLALGSGGTTSWERCRAGLPTLMTIVADNQRGVAGLLERAGIVKIVQGGSIAALTDAFAAGLAQAISDRDWRAKASQAGMELIDGKGGTRLIDEISRLGLLARARRIN